MASVSKTFRFTLVVFFLMCLFFPSSVIPVQCASTWNTLNVSPSGSGGTLALDSHNNPHLIYYMTTIVNDSTAESRNYAVWTGTNWTIQTIDTRQSNSSLTSGLTPSSIVLDSNGNPHIIYTENMLYRYYNVNSYSKEADWTTNNVKYAEWTGSSWQIQLLAINSSSVSNLVLNSKGQPSSCYAYDNSSYIPEYGTFKASGWWNYELSLLYFIEGIEKPLN